MIFGAALTLYSVFMAVTWHVTTAQARAKTEFQLSYSVADLHDTVAGAIDTMLDHAAKTAVRKLGAASSRPIEEMSDLAHALDIDEVNVVSLANSAGLLRKKLLRCFTISACGKSITVTRTM